ncbi:MAG: molybdenum cofactor biosynthesis protein MoaE [Oscillospiraceae bacterium]|nr:molybdenum cofactor biosynthesis protein MoaE [Oscillospiraceae bacterium]
MDEWLREAKSAPNSELCGMYLFHRGQVRSTAKAQVRENAASKPVAGLLLSHDEKKLSAALERARAMQGIYYVRVWLAEGELEVGDDIMQVLVGGDIRPNVVAALEALVDELKTNCLEETELF